MRFVFQNLLQCHDKVGTQRSQPVNNTTEDDEREYLYERASQYGDEIKIVRLQKTADPLVSNNNTTNNINSINSFSIKILLGL